MTGRDVPTDHELRDNLQKRIVLVEDEEKRKRDLVPTGSAFSKRHYRAGMAASDRNKQKGNGTGAGNQTTGGSTTGNGTSASGGGSGVSPIDIQAAEGNGLTAANKPTSNNTLGLDIEADDVSYIATVQIGTPPQNFNVIMDSGSADFWVGSEQCQDCSSNATLLGSQGSSSFVASNQQFEVQYGSGAVAGLKCQDTVNLAGLSLTNHSFGVALQESQQFTGAPIDGLMGLAQSTLSEQGVPTPVESLATAGLISAPIASFKISRLSDQLNDGEITFGALDTTKFDQNTLTAFDNVNQQGFWEGAVDDFSVGGQSAGLQGRTAILDTGTTLILAPAQDAATVMQMLGGQCDQQQCTIPCTANASLALTFGNTAFSIEPQDMAVLPVDINDPTGNCTAGIQPGSVGGANEWLVGDVFLKNAYFSVDQSTNQISLAKLTNN